MGSVVFRVQKHSFSEKVLQEDFKELEKLAGKAPAKDFLDEIKDNYDEKKVNKIQIKFLNQSEVTIFTYQQKNPL